LFWGSHSNAPSDQDEDFWPVRCRHRYGVTWHTNEIPDDHPDSTSISRVARGEI